VLEGDLNELTDALFAAEQAERLSSSGAAPAPSPRAGAGA
jgi:hypothetical protein